MINTRRNCPRSLTQLNGLVVIVVAGAVDGEAPGGGGSGVAQPHQGQGGSVGELASDVGEFAVPADGDASQLGPPLACPGGQVLAQRGLGRLRWLGHAAIVPHVPGCIMECVPASPYVICLGDAERAELESLSRRATAPFRLVVRARVVLLAADGLANCLIAERLGICEDTARKWRRRYCEQGIDETSSSAGLRTPSRMDPRTSYPPDPGGTGRRPEAAVLLAGCRHRKRTGT